MMISVQNLTAYDVCVKMINDATLTLRFCYAFTVRL